jgi:hypothetical protein
MVTIVLSKIDRTEREELKALEEFATSPVSGQQRSGVCGTLRGLWWVFIWWRYRPTNSFTS